MTRTKLIMMLAGVALGIGVAPLAGQTREERQELEQRLRELRQEIRDIERQLDRTRGTFRYFGPSVVTLSTNRAQLGVIVRTAASDETDATGALIVEINPGGPADEAGLQSGDIIISIDGEVLTGRYPPAAADESEPAIKLIDLLREREPGDEVTLEYRRDGQTHSTVVTLGQGDAWAGSRVLGFDTNLPRVFAGPGDVRLRVRERGGEPFTVISVWGDVWSDIELVALNEDLGRYFGTDEGLLVVNPPDDDEIDLQSGDVILSIDGRDARSPSRALRILRSYEPGETVNFDIMRDRSRSTVSVEIPEREDGLFWDGGPSRRFFQGRR